MAAGSGFSGVHGFDLSGKTALVTGASSGLGSRFARVLAAVGAKVAVAARRADKLAALVSEIEADGGKARAFDLDVGVVESFPSTVDAIEQALGPVDILINNAGINIEGLAVSMSPEDFDAMMNTNLRGAFFMATEIAKRLIDRKRGGSIVNTASVGSTHVLPGVTVYAMSKAGLHMMTRSLAREWARYEINVNSIAPGYIETDINRDWFGTEAGQKQIKSWPRRRLLPPESLDGAVLLLVSVHGRYMTGDLITVDDGQYI